jgi:HEPN domain-containing protein
MNETLKEWLAKAEGDYHTASREAQATESPNYDAVCFHAQQCVEKLMKAWLIQNSVVPPRTHDLPQLDQLLQAACPDWSWPVEELRYLTRAAVDFRYPGETADADEAREALAICKRIREKLLAMIHARD